MGERSVFRVRAVVVELGEVGDDTQHVAEIRQHLHPGDEHVTPASSIFPLIAAIGHQLHVAKAEAEKKINKLNEFVNSSPSRPPSCVSASSPVPTSLRPYATPPSR